MTLIQQQPLKIVLLSYSINSTDKGSIEQYGSTKVNNEKIIGSLILRQFLRVGGNVKDVRSVCNQNLVEHYNRVNKDRL